MKLKLSSGHLYIIFFPSYRLHSTSLNCGLFLLLRKGCPFLPPSHIHQSYHLKVTELPYS